MTSFNLFHKSNLDRDSIFKISTDVENFHKVMPEYFKSLKIIHTSSIETIVSETKQKFDTALESDFNTSLALTEFFNMIKIINGLAAEEKITKNTASIVMPILEEMIDILGLNLEKTTDDEIKSIFELLEKRENCRKNKQFDEADKIRDEIASIGISLIDHKSRTLWMKKETIKAEK